jgi:hypothetical protein
MSRMQTLTIICDNCGRMSQHIIASIGFAEQTFTMEPLPTDWLILRRIGGGDLSPPVDYCPTCKEARYGKEKKTA